MTELTAGELAATGSFLADQELAVAGRLRSVLITAGRSDLTILLEDGRSRWVLRMPPREFHLALAYFKIGVIAAGIDYRFRSGATAGIRQSRKGYSSW
jgi:hypothetical protein